MSLPLPLHAIAAVTHPDPAPYYRALLERPGVHWDASLGMWIAARAAAVTEVLTCGTYGVRPPSEPVPRALVGTAAGALFAQLVRVTDGAAHDVGKAAVCHALHRLDLAVVAEESRRRAVRLPLEELDALPVHVMASVLGAPDAQLGDITRWTRDLIRGFAGGDAECGSVAARELLRVFPDANTIGCLIQSHDATAGLLGNTLLALASGRHDPVPDVVRWVVRYDPPVHNTRRYTAGATILVVLAAANLDTSADGPFTFGVGPHACPGARLATTLATAAVEALLDDGLDLERIHMTQYRPLANVRIPVLTRQAP
jgi:cytochrome P450